MADFQNSPQVLPTAPPPSEEVKVRTLKSDLASIATSGGGLPRYQNVKIATEEKQKNITGLITAVAVVILFAIIVAIAVYFVNQLVLKK